MLCRLSIRNFILITSIDLEFDNGLCVLTGETGAGKSILLDALGLALGARAEKNIIYQNKKMATITAAFKLKENHPVQRELAQRGYEGSEEIFLKRVLTNDGKSRAYINEQPTTVSLLRSLGKLLVQIEGQSSSSELLNPQNHQKLLDIFADNETELKATSEAYENWHTTSKKLDRAIIELEKSRHDEAYLRHVTEELNSIAPNQGEEEFLRSERTRLMDQQKLSKILLGAQQDLMSSQPITERLNSAAHHLENGQKMGTAKLDTVLSAIQRASIEATEAEAALEDAIQELDLESETLESLEERLFTLKALARKHNTDIESLGSLLTDFQSRLDLIDKNDEYIEDLSEKCKMTRKIYEEHSQALSLCRNKAAKALDKAIFSELKPLKLGNARFKTYIEEVSEEAQNKFGINRVRFQITTTPGTELGPIEKVASGGERARLLLALKVCLSHSADISTLIFDEVDEGVGGAVANAVGQRLAKLGENIQVLIVTHSPQVAARAKQHFLISKTDPSQTTVATLNEQEREQEIARMLSAEKITKEAIAAARILIAGQNNET